MTTKMYQVTYSDGSETGPGVREAEGSQTDRGGELQRCHQGTLEGCDGIRVPSEGQPALEVAHHRHAPIHSGNPLLTQIPCYSNITLCYLKKEEFEHVVTFASRVIENDRENTKAHYRRGVAYKKLKKYDESIRDLERAKLLDSSLTDAINNILREISALQKS